MVSGGHIIAVLLGSAILFGAFYGFWRMDARRASRMASRVVEIIRPRTSPGHRKLFRILYRIMGVWFIVVGAYSFVRVAMSLHGGADVGDGRLGLGVFGAAVVIGFLFVRYANRLSNPWNEP